MSAVQFLVERSVPGQNSAIPMPVLSKELKWSWHKIDYLFESSDESPNLYFCFFTQIHSIFITHIQGRRNIL